ncbi:MAG: hypothetical protein HY727_07700 [Candidatus Rokubacteria bacterium]|nr:hypothetical protein [Candidatus Rokubacteria bacterium]
MRIVGDALAGLAAAVRARLGTFVGAAIAVTVLSVAVPPLLLSVVRKPVDFVTINPWLRTLPEYLASPDHGAWTKAEKLSNLALFWFSADSAYGGTEWGFAIDVRDVVRITATSLLVGVYVALWRDRRHRAPRPGPARAGNAGGVAGGLAAVLGLSTGPCSVVGCGAPVLPVVGLVFTGLTSTTLKLLGQVSIVATTTILVVLLVAVAHLAWQAGGERRRARLTGT